MSNVAEEILLLEPLVRLDTEADAARARRRALDAAVKRVEAELVEVGERITAARAAREEATRAEAEVQEQLDKYESRAARTRKQLDAGAIPDYLAAEKQLANYAEIMDGLETDLLERMELREQAEERVTNLAALQHRKEHVRSKAIDQRAEEGAALADRLGVLMAERPERVEALPPWLQREYASEREIHLDATSRITADGACTACRVIHPKQVTNEARAQTRLQRCRGCQRFLLGPAIVPPDEDGENGEDGADAEA